MVGYIKGIEGDLVRNRFITGDLGMPWKQFSKL